MHRTAVIFCNTGDNDDLEETCSIHYNSLKASSNEDLISTASWCLFNTSGSERTTCENSIFQCCYKELPGEDFGVGLRNDSVPRFDSPGHIIQVTSNEQRLSNYSSLLQQRANDGNLRIKHDVELKGKRQFEHEKVIIPEDLSEPHARGSAVKMSCLANGYQPSYSSGVSDKTEDLNEEGLIHPCTQYNFEPFHSAASRRPSGMPRYYRESSNNTDKHSQAAISIHVDHVRCCIDQLTDQLVWFDNENCS
ncbi:hypothetical protein GJ496_008500 [Pomphorhynchus laevis]|nr:hypothetical protein GJ496_008500 [Pomphorhynchus laevis]